MKKDILRKLFGDFGFPFFTVGEYNINLFGVRRGTSDPNKFDDIICVATETENGWFTWAMPATTDPGSPVLGKSGMGNKNGTAMLPASTLLKKSYKFKIGKHKNKYPALNQATAFTLVRDNDKDGKLLNPQMISKAVADGNIYTGYFGINIHHASSKGISPSVENWSWGCQVVQSIFDWEKLWSLIKRSKLTFGSTFSYTLFNEQDIVRSLGCNLDSFFSEMNSSPFESNRISFPAIKQYGEIVAQKVEIVKSHKSTYVVAFPDGKTVEVDKSLIELRKI